MFKLYSEKHNIKYLILFVLIFSLAYLNFASIFFNNSIGLGGLFSYSILIIPLFYLKKGSILYISIIYFILGVPLLFYGFHYIEFDVPPTEFSYVVIFETNNSEVLEFFKSYLSIRLFYLFILVFLMPLFCVLLLVKYKSIYVENKIPKFFLTLIFVMVNIIFVEHSLLYNQISTFIKVRKQIVNYEFWKKKYKSNAKYLKNVERTIKVDSNEIHVVIIGESLSKSHLGIYGYYRNTTPNLEKMKNELYLFKDVISPHCYTTGSLIKSLTLQSWQNNLKNKISLIDIVNAANFKTYWISNQPFLGPHENLISAIAQNCDTVISTNYSRVTDDKLYFDELVFDEFQSVIDEKVNRPKYIFVHLMGSHLQYKSRSPSNFNLFKDEDKHNLKLRNFVTKKEIQKINHYDNSVYYNDYVISTLINKLKIKNLKSSLLYFSDHGEELCEDVNFIGHNEGKPTKNMFAIPFILWLSDKYKMENVKLTSNIDYFLNRKYQTDDLIFSCLDLINVRFNDFDSTKSIFNLHFREEPRLHSIKNEVYNLDSAFTF